MVDNGDRPGRNTSHPRGIRITTGVLAGVCVIFGPVGYLNAISAGPSSAPEWYTLGFAAAVGIPLLAAAIATVAGDRRAAMWSLGLLAWPFIFIAPIHVLAGM